jgi:hypothetical protein
VSHKVVELTVIDRAAATVALDHKHLVAVLRVNMVVLHVENC